VKEYLSFNSTLVRLKELEHDKAQALFKFQFHTGSIKSSVSVSPSPNNLCFNSTLVRLKASTSIYQPPEFCVFQFHTGSIKSDLETRLGTPSDRFNSTLVRLKDRQEMQGFIDQLSFNSTLVRLKGGMKEYPDKFFDCFNSTLVRLKAAMLRSRPDAEIVSIPHWFD